MVRKISPLEAHLTKAMWERNSKPIWNDSSPTDTNLCIYVTCGVPNEMSDSRGVSL